MTLREMAEKAANRFDCGGRHDCPQCRPGTADDIADEIERVASAWLNENLTTCPICSCVRCDALRRKYAARSSGGK